MHGERREQPIVTAHHRETLLERRTMVLGGITAIHEISHDTWHSPEWQVSSFCLLHHADAPIHVSRVTVLQIVGNVAGNVLSGVECLMAHQHAFPKRAPRQTVGHAQMALAQESSLAVHDVGIAIDDGGPQFRSSGVP